MSMTISAVVAGSNVNGYGLGVDLHGWPPFDRRDDVVDVATAPKTPPCIVTMCRAASWLAGSVAPVQSDRIRHS